MPRRAAPPLPRNGTPGASAGGVALGPGVPRPASLSTRFGVQDYTAVNTIASAFEAVDAGAPSDFALALVASIAADPAQLAEYTPRIPWDSRIGRRWFGLSRWIRHPDKLRAWLLAKGVEISLAQETTSPRAAERSDPAHQREAASHRAPARRYQTRQSGTRQAVTT